ncbi:hypothetical protein [Intestinibaculum porci]|uniref:hypothetical protein n=1 Tax=Intestinibaculum porci TaxID=2487118 RepID=UPI002409822D|nr:hypothetical protein [Intestinibaculum porci]MDD6350606.1 hypothetical protein [Intestinibaculum porci]MDD6422674.1 hypothetical protein [Intestinibaculum porci]
MKLLKSILIFSVLLTLCGCNYGDPAEQIVTKEKDIHYLDRFVKGKYKYKLLFDNRLKGTNEGTCIFSFSFPGKYSISKMILRKDQKTREELDYYLLTYNNDLLYYRPKNFHYQAFRQLEKTLRKKKDIYYQGVIDVHMGEYYTAYYSPSMNLGLFYFTQT